MAGRVLEVTLPAEQFDKLATDLTPYRGMERFIEPTVADEMRDVADRARAGALKEQVDKYIANIRRIARGGEYSCVFGGDYDRMDQETATLVAQALELYGFDTEVVPREYWRPWYRRADPSDAIWQIQVKW